ncbi:MAG: DUF2796 domain-containing protein [Pseudomonadota bacterium]
MKILVRKPKHMLRTIAAAISLSLGTLLIPSMAWAADAHVHGEAELEIVVEASDLLISLRGPAQVFFGFEHAPETEEQAKTVRSALAALNDPSNSVFTTSTACTVSVVEIDAPFTGEVLASSAHDHEHHDSDDHHGDEDDHDHHHDDHDAGMESQDEHAESHDEDEHHADHDDHEEHSEHDDEHGGHSDLEAEYALSCPAGAPDRIELIAFDAFPEMEEVEAAWLNVTGGGSAELTPSKRVVEISR